MAGLPDPNSGSRLRRPRWRWLLLGGMLLVVLLIRLGAWQGLLRPVRIAGDSMADTFLGPHYVVHCADCGIDFHCGLDFPPADGEAMCPNCGYADNSVESLPIVAGQRVVIDRWLMPWQRVRTWQAVAFSYPADREFLAIKRVVAGGSGRVAIRHGDVYVDGHIQRKTLDQLRQVCILVHDDHFRPSRNASLPSRWSGISDDSAWKCVPAGYELDRLKVGDQLAVDWLRYNQWVCWPNASPPAPRYAPAPILDHYGYNQSLSRSGLHRITDLLLQCNVMLRGQGRLLLQINAGTDTFQLELTCPPQTIRLVHNGETAWRLPAVREHLPWDVSLAVCDQQVFGSIAGQRLPTYSYTPLAASPSQAQTQLAIGARGVRVQLEAPRIYRDLYYLGPGGEQVWEDPEPLQYDQYFVLGDNVPISIDSRLGGAIDRADIVGSVFGW